MNSLDSDGVSKRVHLEKQAYGLFSDPEALAQLETAPRMPTLTADVWAYYQQLAKRREFTEIGPKRFTWVELQAWMIINRISINDWVLDLICSIDDLFISQHLKTQKQNNPSA